MSDLDTELLGGIAPAEQARLSIIQHPNPIGSHTAGLVSSSSPHMPHTERSGNNLRNFVCIEDASEG